MDRNVFRDLTMTVVNEYSRRQPPKSTQGFGDAKLLGGQEMGLESARQIARPARWSKEYALHCLRRPRAVLGVAVIATAWLAGCSSLAGAQPRGVDASDDELLVTLANLARRGTEAICNPTVLEKELNIKIGKLETQSFEVVRGEPVLRQTTSDVRAAIDTEKIKEGGYMRFRSSISRRCHIYIYFSSPRICNKFSEKTASIMGVPMSIGPYPPLPGPQYGAVMFVYGFGEAKTRVGLGDTSQLCANGFGISSEGDWK